MALFGLIGRKKTIQDEFFEDFLNPTSEIHKEFEEIIRKMQLISELVDNEKKLINNFRNRIGYDFNFKERILRDFQNSQARGHPLTILTDEIGHIRDRLRFELNFLEKNLDKAYPTKELDELLKDTKRLRKNVLILSDNIKKKNDKTIYIIKLLDKETYLTTHQIADYLKKLYDEMKYFEHDEEKIKAHIKELMKKTIPETINKCNEAGRFIMQNLNTKKFNEIEIYLTNMFNSLDNIFIQLRNQLSGNNIAKLEIIMQRGQSALNHAKNDEKKFESDLAMVKSQLKI